MVVVYTTVVYAFIENEKSIPINSGLDSDLSALSAIAPSPGDGRPRDADSKVRG